MRFAPAICERKECARLEVSRLKAELRTLVLGGGGGGGSDGGLGGDFEEGSAVGALDVFAAGGFGDDEDGAALEVRAHDADIFDRIHERNLQ
jgi:hypothetical protein